MTPHLYLYNLHGDPMTTLSATDWMRAFLQREFVLTCTKIDLDGSEHYTILDVRKGMPA